MVTQTWLGLIPSTEPGVSTEHTWYGPQTTTKLNKIPQMGLLYLWGIYYFLSLLLRNSTFLTSHKQFFVDDFIMLKFIIDFIFINQYSTLNAIHFLKTALTLSFPHKTIV